jgi:hypothetical protein
MGTTLTLTLISHTNVGKTTLARTLLARDIGEVRDAPHVTTEAAAYPLIETAEGDRLLLWDTPGFGDSARLARRLAQEANPIGWFLAQVWDRWRDRAFWLTQQALHTVREHTDVVLYLVNAAEAPQDAGYLASELAVLAWLDKPVLVLLNQMGPLRSPPRGSSQDSLPSSVADAQATAADDETRWRAALAAYPQVRGVLAFDAFARCWVQEFVLFDAIAPLVPEASGAAFERLLEGWRARRLTEFDAAMAALAQPVAAAIGARIALPRVAMLRRIGAALGVSSDEMQAAQERALRELSARVDEDLRDALTALIAIHGLSGHAVAEVEARVDKDLAHDGPLPEGRAAAVGGVVSGAVTGLAADLAAGGLTFGAGMLTGAALGALGGAGVARAVNVARGRSGDVLRWDDAFLARLIAQSLMRYLAIAHYGRGRGDYVDSGYPPHWREAVAQAIAARHDAWTEVFALRASDNNPEAVAAQLIPLLRETALALLADFYPESGIRNQESEDRDQRR